MKIKSLELKNFRCYEDKQIEFTDNSGQIQMLNVIIGDNGAGKTTILEGIAKGFIPILRTINKQVTLGEDFKDISFNDMHRNHNWTKIGITCEFNSENYSWHNSKSRTSAEEKGEIIPQKGIKNAIENRSESGDFPLLVYYAVNRMFTVPVRGSNRYSGLTASHALDSSLTSVNEFRRFYNWFKNESYNDSINYYRYKDFKSLKLKAVRDAIKNVLIDYSDLEIKNMPSRMVVRDTYGNEFNVTNFSGGYKAVFALVSDIASRLAMAYPESQHPLEGSAVILIDELDLHLHPKWQKRICEDLRRTFPNCQFVISTHSPFIVQSLNKSEIIDIERTIDREALSGSYEGYALDRIQELMGVTPGTKVFENQLMMFNAAIEDGNKEAAKDVFNTVKRMVSESDKILNLMELDIIAAGLEND